MSAGERAYLVAALENYAEHVYRLAQGAKSRLEDGRVDAALDDLRNAKDSAERIEYTLKHAIRSLEEHLDS